MPQGDEGYDPSAEAPLPVFLCDPPSMDLAIDETQDVTVWAFPSGGATGTVSDKLVATIQDNPTLWLSPFHALGRGRLLKSTSRKLNLCACSVTSRKPR